MSSVGDFWNFESYEDFCDKTKSEMLSNTYVTKDGLLHKFIKKSKGDIQVQYISEIEQEMSENAVGKPLVSYILDDVSYIINEMGFRGSVIRDKNSIACYGCSTTYGIGLPEKDIFHHVLGDRLSRNVHNFGAPGAGVDKISRYFNNTSNYFEFTTAIFMLPSMYRFEKPAKSFDNISNKEVFFQENILPRDNNTEVDRIYGIFDDNYFKAELIRNVHHIQQIGKTKNILTYFSSWDDTTYKTLKQYLGNDSEFLLPTFNSTEVNATLARDGSHSGPDVHRHFAQTISPIIR